MILSFGKRNHGNLVEFYEKLYLTPLSSLLGDISHEALERETSTHVLHRLLLQNGWFISLLLNPSLSLLAFLTNEYVPNHKSQHGEILGINVIFLYGQQKRHSNAVFFGHVTVSTVIQKSILHLWEVLVQLRLLYRLPITASYFSRCLMFSERLFT